MIRRCLITSLLWLAADITWAQPIQDWIRMKAQTPRGYQCRRTTTPIAIDGRLEDVAWRQAPWTQEFLDIQGPHLPKPKFDTRAKMLWDSEYFYIAALLKEPHIWGTLTNRDAVIFQDNDFEVFIDPDGDGHEYFEFEMNALNTQWDLRLVKAYKDGGPALNEWDIAGIKTAVHIEGTLNDPRDVDRWWSVEIALPWRALGQYSLQPSPPVAGDRWRVDFSRVEWQIDLSSGRYVKVPKKPEDNWVWSPTGIIDMHRPDRWGIVEFASSEAPKRAIRPNDEDAIRERLMEVYYLQRQFLADYKRYAASFDELVPIAKAAGLTWNEAETPRLWKTPEGYVATLQASPNSSTRWHVRQDARLWKE